MCGLFAHAVNNASGQQIRSTKSEIRNKYQMPNKTNSKQYDLEDRTMQSAKDCRLFVKKLPKTTDNLEDVSQLIRASGSVGANYIEANEALSKRDFRHRIKICKKESKEARYWLRLVDTREKTELEDEREQLVQEATELMNIFGSILANSQRDKKRGYL